RPKTRVQFRQGAENISGGLVDQYLPIGFGQRVAVVAPQRVRRIGFYQDLASGVRANHPDAAVFLLLLDERPEEVTEVQRSVDAEVLFSTFDEPAARHVQVADMALERAKRLAEQGRDVVLFVDSLSRLARASHASTPVGGKLMSSAVDIAALQCVRKIFGAARCIEEGGSLTMFATLLSGSSFDEVLAEDILGAANGIIQLDASLAQRDMHPAIALWESSTGARENFLSSEELAAVKSRRGALAGDVKEDLSSAINQLD
ncbi:MAG: transcription termination factor Rho, partial [Myxococcota bacterium]